MTSIIKSLALSNFKGFSDEVRIELRPITLLFGPNSAGKSSVFQALHYVREILERENVNADRTLQGGDAIDLGGFLSLVHGRDKNKQIEIAIEMALGASSIPELVPDAFEDWQTSDKDVWWMYETLQNIRRAVQTVDVRLRVGWNAQREQPVVQGYEIHTNGEWCIKITASADGRDAQMRINNANSIFMVDGPDGDELLSELTDFVSAEDLGGADTDRSVQQPNATPGRVSVMSSVFDMVKEAGMERPGDGLRAWLTGFRGALPRLDQMLFIPAPGAKGAQNVYMVREFTAFLTWLTVGPALLLRDQLRQMRYIGPLRRVPPRGFELSLTKSDSAWSDGMAAWETLVTGSQDLVKRVSEWMQSPAKLGTGYAVARKDYQEFDPTPPVPKSIGPIRKRAQLMDSAGLTLHPQDVGVGISQVLPVVVAAQDGSASLVCIEQPELHIHPAIQVGLGDLFIDGVVDQGLSFLIETHSEHLILRLLRRIRENAESTSKGTDQPMSPALIGVYCLSKRDGAVTIDEIPVTKDGDFAKPWPQGFFDERGAELF
jgi:hypothetical protein